MSIFCFSAQQEIYFVAGWDCQSIVRFRQTRNSIYAKIKKWRDKIDSHRKQQLKVQINTVVIVWVCHYARLMLPKWIKNDCTPVTKQTPLLLTEGVIWTNALHLISPQMPGNMKLAVNKDACQADRPTDLPRQGPWKNVTSRYDNANGLPSTLLVCWNNRSSSPQS